MLELNGTPKDAHDALLLNHVVLFYFTATWCGPCSKIGPECAKLSEAEAYSGIKVFKIDVDSNGDIADK